MPEDPLPSDLFIENDHPDFSRTGLRTASTLRLHRLMTLPMTIVRRELGELSPSLRDQVAERLRQLLHLS